MFKQSSNSVKSVKGDHNKVNDSITTSLILPELNNKYSLGSISYQIQSISEISKSINDLNYDSICRSNDMPVAHQLGKLALKTTIQRKVREAMKKRRDYALIYYDNLIFDSNGFSPNTILYGFWDSNTKKHYRQDHEQIGISQTIVEEAIQELYPLGYIITDISDSTRSNKKIIRVDFNSNDRYHDQLNYEDCVNSNCFERREKRVDSKNNSGLNNSIVDNYRGSW